MDKTDTRDSPVARRYCPVPRCESQVPAPGLAHRIAYADLVAEDTPNPDATPTPGSRLARSLGLYTLARLLLVVVIAALILGVAAIVGVAIPLLVALIFAVVIALPLSLVLFKTLRIRVNEAIADVDEKRRRDKADLRARLRGGDEEKGGSAPR
jgi:Protein of unknown function (DUF4229)